MHYIDVGEGNPVVFLHGNPTSSYLWRNVVPHVRSHARCIAPDLIGMGRSGKPDIAYTYEDHYRYLTAFVEELALEDITLVLHDWGSGLGFRYAHEHPENVAGLAFMESMVRPWSWDEMDVQSRLLFKALRTPVVGWGLASVANLFVNGLLPYGIVRDLSDEELEWYREPYPSIASRKPVRVWPREVPIDGSPARVHRKMIAYAEWLPTTEIPKLCLYAHPGFLIQSDEVAYIEHEFRQTTTVDLGSGRHYLQEDHPHEIGEEIAAWYTRVV